MGKARIKLKGQIRSYVQWPLRFSILIIVFNIIMYLVNVRAGLYTTAFAVIYIGISLALYFRSRTIVFNDFISFATQYGQVQKQLLKGLPLPYALLDENGCAFPCLDITSSQELSDEILPQVMAIPATLFFDRSGNLVGNMVIGAPERNGSVVEGYLYEIQNRLAQVNGK